MEGEGVMVAEVERAKNALRPMCEVAFCSLVQKHTSHYLF